MDAESSQDRRPGGTVQPANQTTTPRQRTPKAETPVVERYELRDPFAEVTYRAKTLSQMELQAERLGALRFHAVAPDGTRTPIEKVNGAWERLEVGETQPTASTRDKQKRTADVASITPMPAEPEGIAAQIDADAARAARIERLELDLRERYVIKRASMKCRRDDDRAHRIPLPRRHRTSGVHRINVQVVHGQQQSIRGPIHGGRQRSEAVASVARLGA
jgi:hypothetical protein